MHDTTSVILVKLLPLTPFALLGFSLVASAWLSLAPAPGHPIATFYPPWWTATRAFDAIASAGGNVVRLAGLPTLLVAAAGPTDLSDRLLSSGALLVLDASRLAGCVSDP